MFLSQSCISTRLGMPLPMKRRINYLSYYVTEQEQISLSRSSALIHKNAISNKIYVFKKLRFKNLKKVNKLKFEKIR